MTDLTPLFTAARDDDPRVRQEAAMVLGVRGTDETVDEVVQLMVDEPDDFVRETLIWAICTRGSSGVPALTKALYEPDTERERVLHTLSKIGDPSTLPAIIPHADDPDRIVAAKAWWALGRIGTPESLPVLLKHLGEGDADRRLGLSRALLVFGPDAIAPVAERLDDPEPVAAEHAAEVLLRFTDSAQYPLADRRGGHVERATDLLVESASPAVDLVVTAFANGDDETLQPLAEEISRRRVRN